MKFYKNVQIIYQEAGKRESKYREQTENGT